MIKSVFIKNAQAAYGMSIASVSNNVQRVYNSTNAKRIVF